MVTAVFVSTLEYSNTKIRIDGDYIDNVLFPLPADQNIQSILSSFIFDKNAPIDPFYLHSASIILAKHIKNSEKKT
jgi:hypothetical protein